MNAAAPSRTIKVNITRAIAVNFRAIIPPKTNYRLLNKHDHCCDIPDAKLLSWYTFHKVMISVSSLIELFLRSALRYSLKPTLCAPQAFLSMHKPWQPCKFLRLAVAYANWPAI